MICKNITNRAVKEVIRKTWQIIIKKAVINTKSPVYELFNVAVFFYLWLVKSP